MMLSTSISRRLLILLTVLTGIGIAAALTVQKAPRPLLRQALQDASGGTVEIVSVQAEGWTWKGPRRLRARGVTINEAQSWPGVRSFEVDELVLEALSGAELADGQLERLTLIGGHLLLDPAYEAAEARDSENTPAMGSALPRQLEIVDGLEARVIGVDGVLRLEGEARNLHQAPGAGLSARFTLRSTELLSGSWAAGSTGPASYVPSTKSTPGSTVAPVDPVGTAEKNIGRDIRTGFLPSFRLEPLQAQLTVAEVGTVDLRLESSALEVSSTLPDNTSATDHEKLGGLRITGPIVTLRAEHLGAWQLVSTAEVFEAWTGRPSAPEGPHTTTSKRLLNPQIAVNLIAPPEGGWHLKAVPDVEELGGVGSLELRWQSPAEGTFQQASSADGVPGLEETLAMELRRADLQLRNLDLDLLLPLLPGGPWAGAGTLDLGGQYEAGTPARLHARVRPPRVRPAASSRLTLPILEANVLWTAATGDPRKPLTWLRGSGDVEIEVDDGWQLAGAGKMPSKSLPLRLELRVHPASTEEIAALETDPLPALVRRSDLRLEAFELGRWTAKAETSPQEPTAAWPALSVASENVEAEAFLAIWNGLAVDAPPVAATGTLRVDATVMGLPAAPRLTARVETAAITLTGSPPGPRLEGHLSSRWLATLSRGDDRGGFALRRLALESLRLEGQASALPFPMGPSSALPLQLEVAGLRRPDGAFELSELLVDLGPRGRALARGTLGSDGAGDGVLELREVPLEGWRHTLWPDGTGDSLPPTLGLTGTVSADLQLRRDSLGLWNLQGDAAIDGTGFESQSGARVLQGLDSRWTLEGLWRPTAISQASSDTWRLDGQGHLEGFQLLWDAFYGDFSEARSNIGWSLWAPGADASDDGLALAASPRGAVHWNLPGGVLLRAAGETEVDGHWQATAALTVEDAGEAWERLLAAPLQSLDPELAATRLDGRLDLALEVNGAKNRDSLDLHGRLRAEGDGATTLDGDAVEVVGLALDLPLSGRWHAGRLLPTTADSTFGTLDNQDNGESTSDTTGPSDGNRGQLAFDSARFRGLRLPATATGILTQGDTVVLDDDLVLPTLGGRLTLRSLALESLTGAAPRLTAGLSLEDLDLARLATTLQTLPLEGRLDATVPRLSLQGGPGGGTLVMDGGAEAQLFGGRVAIGEVTGREVFSAYPRIAFSAALQDLDLGRLTRRFDFGEMGGVLEGEVHHLSLFGAVPVSLSAELRTARRRGISQTVSIKAVNNIALVGTGASASALESGLLGLLDRFTYRQLGVAMELRDDRFLLRGLIQDDGVEYFLRGRLPFPIDVVNAQPGQTVSFQSMLDRLQALNLNAARVGPREPSNNAAATNL